MVPLLLEYRPVERRDLDWLLWLRRETMTPHQQAAGLEPTEARHAERVMDDYEAIRIAVLDRNDVAMIKLIEETSEWHLDQLQVDPLLHRSGIGSRMLEDLLVSARDADMPVSLRVLKVNPARRLYERFGFVTVSETELAWRMRWTGDT